MPFLAESAGETVRIRPARKLSHPNLEVGFAVLSLFLNEHRLVICSTHGISDLASFLLFEKGAYLNAPGIGVGPITSSAFKNLDSNAGDALLDHSQCPGGTVGEIDDTTGDKGTAVVDRHDNAPSRIEVVDADYRTEGQ